MTNTQKLGVLLLFIAASSMALYAQQDSQAGADNSTGTSQQPAAPGADQQAGNQTMQPDTHPLTGIDMLGVGNIVGRSYLQPVFAIGESGSTNTEVVPGLADYETETFPIGGLELQTQGEKNSLALQYVGGGMLYNKRPSLDSYFNEFGLNDIISLKRLQLEFSEHMDYLPGTSYGFPGLFVTGGLQAANFGTEEGLGSGLGNVNPMFGGGSFIMTGLFGTTSASSAVEGTYSATARTSVTAAGVYTTLQFNRGSSLTNMNEYLGSLGINHELTARDTIGVMGDYAQVYYSGVGISTNFSTVGLSYGHQITGRLSFQAFAGPEFVVQHTPTQGAISSTLAAGNVGLSYKLPNTSFSGYVGRFAYPGSGLITGAEVTMASIQASHKMTRTWSIDTFVSGARTSGFQGSIAPNGNRFTYWFAGTNLQHPVSHTVSLTLGYEYLSQSAGAAVCNSVVCGSGPGMNVFGVGLSFRPRPIGL